MGACASPRAGRALAQLPSQAARNTHTCHCRWEYALDGRLRKATRMAGIRNFRAAEHGLVPISLGVWGRFLFLHLGESQTPQCSWPRIRALPVWCSMYTLGGPWHVQGAVHACRPWLCPYQPRRRKAHAWTWAMSPNPGMYVSSRMQRCWTGPRRNVRSESNAEPQARLSGMKLLGFACPPRLQAERFTQVQKAGAEVGPACRYRIMPMLCRCHLVT